MRLFQFSGKNKIRVILTGYIVIILVALLPIILVFLAGSIAESHDCVLNEAGSHPCVIGGTDYGDLLAMAFVFGWAMLLSIPAGILGLIIWTNMIIQELRFSKNSIKLTLHDYNLSYIGDRMFLDTHIEYKGENRSLRVFFTTKKQEVKFQPKESIIIAGILIENSPGGYLILDNTRVIN